MHSKKPVCNQYASKAIQATDTPVKVIKGNSNFLHNKYVLISMNLLVKENVQIV